MNAQKNTRVNFVVICLWMIVSTASAQTAPGKYWVRFTDKSQSPFSLSRPQEFLSEKCIERRIKLGIGFDDLDLPVNQHYINEVLSLGPAVLHHKSKWMNAITIYTEDASWLSNIAQLPFVAEVKSLALSENVNPDFESYAQENKFGVEDFRGAEFFNTDPCDSFPEYGMAWRQTEMLNVQWLHKMGFMGEGIDIAQFDAGWSRTDQLPAFERLRNDGRIKMVRDFVWVDNSNVYTYNSHGTSVLSIMATWLPGKMIGVAPDANYYLFRTEDPYSEYPVETDNWVVAAELCDSLGIDIINSSLGYSLMDNASMNFTYADMNGSTTHCSIAANIAARKGILVVNSAGNSGDDPWYYLTAPSDADGILGVGAVDAQGHHAWFSSYGPSADGRVKPEVAAMGRATAYVAQDSTVRTGNGTSFSSPLIAASAACLHQAFPEASSFEIRDAIIRSASDYLSPTDSLGNGIPNFYRAWQMLQGNAPSVGDFEASLYPNPCIQSMRVTLNKAMSCEIAYRIYDSTGRQIFSGSGVSMTDGHGSFELDSVVAKLAPGNYTLHLQWELRNSIVSFTKIATQ
ncbi:MAG: hypothetical protein RL040_365 [Bacteroidota bacterium]